MDEVLEDRKLMFRTSHRIGRETKKQLAYI